MSEHQPPPDGSRSEDEAIWRKVGSAKPEPLPARPTDTRLDRAFKLLPVLATLLLAFAGVWLGWWWFQSHRPVPDHHQPEPESPAVLTAEQSCEKVTRLIRELPNNEDGIKTVTPQIEKEIDRVEGLGAQIERDPREWAGLGLIYGELRKARVGLAGKVEPFMKREAGRSAADPKSDSLTIKHAEEMEIAFGPGKDLLDAVERYDVAIRKLVDRYIEKVGDSGATWGK